MTDEHYDENEELWYLESDSPDVHPFFKLAAVSLLGLILVGSVLWAAFSCGAIGR